MSEREQKAFLAKALPPQQYGFKIFPLENNGIGFRGTARLHPNHLATVQFKKGDVPVIAVRGRSSSMKMNALLDPSSPSSWMEFSKSQEFDAVFLGTNKKVIPYRGSYNTGGANAYAAVVSQMRVNQLFLENIPLYVRMANNSLGPLARGTVVPHVDAVIGYDILHKFEYIQFDLKNHTVSLSSSIPYVPHRDLLMTEAKIVRETNYGLAVKGAIFGKPTPIILDFGGDYHFARGDAKVSTTRQVSIGDVVYREVPTLLLPITGTPPRAGRRMLEKYIITICNSKGVVYFERIPE